ncbi:hypothetical protein DL89DRAFT_267905 [Linderina pennispora]|uniref:C2H2-type domain-containing protein n=1 Tax=Linderina pennispora TaxID=61395 RepID=A0A1Y1W8G7_9FUNG|nr:uncharacterized protein DL89DRAFT_267905 [Linderina pennispora]ORX69742.1 hypothetical protein DL89DRAFT_267905 [Linderina pennispora]
MSPAITTPGSTRSSPGLFNHINHSAATGPATMRTPMHLGLSECSYARPPPLKCARHSIPSLSTKTADGSRVSILNDSDQDPAATHDRKRCLSVPGPSPVYSTASYSPFRAQSTPGATPQQAPSSLPSLNTLVQAVGLVTSESSAVPPPANNRTHSLPVMPLHRQAPPPPPTQTNKTMAKRKYKCTFTGCGKAFTTSGHLARHQRIHTGEKNFPCLFPGCTSRFSRQDNMMQHYRTHLSSKSRRNGSPRKVVFLDPVVDPYRASPGMYGTPNYANTAPVHHPYAHPHAHPHHAQRHSASVPTSVPQQYQQPQVTGQRAPTQPYGLPAVHMLAANNVAPGSPATSHEYHHSMPKQPSTAAPRTAAAGPMAYY